MIANSLNQYFTSIADDIPKKRKYEGHRFFFHEYLLNSTNQSFLIYNCGNVEIKNRIFKKLIKCKNPDQKSQLNVQFKLLKNESSR